MSTSSALLLLKLLFLLIFPAFISHIFLCTVPTYGHVRIFLSFNCLFTSSFHHHVSRLLLLPHFFSHTLSHATKIPYLKSPLKFGVLISTESITFSSHHFVILKSLIKRTIFLSVHVFLTTFLILFLSLSTTTNAYLSSPGIAFSFHINRRCPFLSTHSQFLSHFHQF